MSGVLRTVAVMGNSSVGKTGIVIQMTSNVFIENPESTVEESYRKRMLVDGQAVMAEFLDTSGKIEDFEALQQQYYRWGMCFVLVYSITSRESFDKISRIYHSLRAVNSTAKVVLIGNKCDIILERQVAKEEGEELSVLLGNCPFFEVSAKERINVEESLLTAVRISYELPALPNIRRSRGPIFNFKFI